MKIILLTLTMTLLLFYSQNAVGHHLGGGGGGSYNKCELKCPIIRRPLCGSDGRNYNNECFASCAGATAACGLYCPCDSAYSRGRKQSCKCPNLFRPVCGNNGKTYPNKCKARCAGVAIACRRSCFKCRGV